MPSGAIRMIGRIDNVRTIRRIWRTPLIPRMGREKIIRNCGHSEGAHFAAKAISFLVQGEVEST